MNCEIIPYGLLKAISISARYHAAHTYEMCVSSCRSGSIVFCYNTRMKKREVRHLPVLLPEVLRVLNPRPGQVFVDCTLGLGGHAVEILKRIGTTGRLIGIDFDPANLAIAEQNLQRVSRNYSIHHTNFAGIAAVLAAEGITHVNGVLADVGVASTQIDDPQRGFSYKKPGPLDMRMDPTRGEPASEWIAKMTEREMADAFLELGDETDALKIARLIVQQRCKSPSQQPNN